MASIPIRPMARPIIRAAKPRIRDDPSTAVTQMKASRMTAKYSGAPIEIANRVITGMVNTTSRVPMVPATKEPIAAVASACAARPPLAIRLPSMAVTTDDDSPGVLSRIEVVDPPYMPPYRIPASMIIAPVGSSPYVIGSSRATVMAGPIPGSTPTAVPTVTPISASSRLIGVAAVAKPSSRS